MRLRLGLCIHYLEALLKVVVFFQEHGIVDNDLWCGNAEVNNTVIDRLRRLKRKGNMKKKLGYLTCLVHKNG